METRWWWIRHAPVPDNGCIYGQRDLDCDCSDSVPFDALAGELPRDAVWLTSSLVRTRQTAAALRASMSCAGAESLEPVAEFAEQNLGDWQGLNRKAFFNERRGPASPFWFAPASERAPNGESFADLVERVSRTIDRLSEKLAGRNLIAVAHGGTIRAAIAHALRLPAAAVFPFVIDNCSLTRLDRLESGVWRVGAVNHRPWVKGADIEVERRPGWADGPPLS